MPRPNPAQRSSKHHWSRFARRLATIVVGLSIIVASSLNGTAYAGSPPQSAGSDHNTVKSTPVNARHGATIASATAPVAMPPTTDYPWKGLTYQNGGDQWGMAYGQCVSYAAWMIYQNNGGDQRAPYFGDQGWFPSDGLSKSPVTYNWGNAGDWNTSAANAGFPVNGTPTVGSIAQWVNGSDGGAFTVGHVAYVTSVNSDGSIDLAQYNLREDSKFSTLHMPRGGATDTSNGHGPFYVSWPDHFLHIYDGGLSHTTPGTYNVTGTDGSLAVQSQPHINHVIGSVAEGTAQSVLCQTIHGDQVDGRSYNGKPFTTWDERSDGYWIYDWYMNTPVIGTDGYSPGVPHCPGG